MPKKERKKKDSPGALFIPAGFLIGFGLGFAFGNVPAGMFLGLGLGFLTWVVYEIKAKRR